MNKGFGLHSATTPLRDGNLMRSLGNLSRPLKGTVGPFPPLLLPGGEVISFTLTQAPPTLP